VKSEIPEAFQHTEKIEVANEDGSLDALLGLEDGSLTLEDPRNVLVELEPLKVFGRACFGTLRFRPVQSDGKKGDWQSLAIVVRVPFLTEIQCLKSSDKLCSLSGPNLFSLTRWPPNGNSRTMFVSQRVLWTPRSACPVQRATLCTSG